LKHRHPVNRQRLRKRQGPPPWEWAGPAGPGRPAGYFCNRLNDSYDRDMAERVWHCTPRAARSSLSLWRNFGSVRNVSFWNHIWTQSICGSVTWGTVATSQTGIASAVIGGENIKQRRWTSTMKPTSCTATQRRPPVLPRTRPSCPDTIAFGDGDARDCHRRDGRVRAVPPPVILT
jgi:hypothetical protein